MRVIRCRVCLATSERYRSEDVMPMHRAPHGADPSDPTQVRQATIHGRLVAVHVGKRSPACAGSLEAPLAEESAR